MSHAIFRVESFEIVAPYTLRIGFDDQTVQTIDFRPFGRGNFLGRWGDVSLFNQARIDLEVRTVVWPNGADFDPATLHEGPQKIEALSALAKEWDLTPA